VVIRVTQYGSLRCVVSAPEAPPSKAELWPILCFLHGRDEAAPLDLQVALTRHGPLGHTSAEEAHNNFVVVAPQLPAPGGNVWRSHIHDVQAIVLAVAREYRVDRARLYLTGFSYGGNGVLDLALLMPSMWAALWAVDPPGVPQINPNCPIWLSAGPYARTHKDLFARVLGVPEVRDETAGDYVYHDARLGHVETARQAYGDGAIYRWLLARRTRVGSLAANCGTT